MPTFEGTKLAETIRAKTAEMRELCAGISEEAASRAPAERWSPKQIISHLSGPDGVGFMPALRLFLEQDVPLINITAEDPFFTDRRSRMTMKDLVAEFEQEYLRMAGFVAAATETELARKARIPLFKDTPLGEYPTLATFVSALAGWHMDFHINHMKEILQNTGAGTGKSS
ncbi:MAG TPA: DinB family protein [Thermodesulfovibrionales bacterium]|nr:DinB family protein [Thermodesulfovibrionales bacterium]